MPVGHFGKRGTGAAIDLRTDLEVTPDLEGSVGCTHEKMSHVGLDPNMG